MNKAILMGNLTKDIEMIQTQSWVAVAKCWLATNERFKKKGSNEYEDITTFHNLVAFWHSANHLNKRFKKWDKILIEWKISNTTYEKQDGTKGYKSEIIIEQMHFAGWKPSQTSQYNNKPEVQTQTKQVEEISVEDLPF